MEDQAPETGFLRPAVGALSLSAPSPPISCKGTACPSVGALSLSAPSAPSQPYQSEGELSLSAPSPPDKLRLCNRPAYILPVWLMLLILGSGVFAEARVVINEVMYDPVGTDTGWEWIELYNAGMESINLEGSYIQRGGSTFVTVFTFPHFILRSGRFVLVGESQITAAHFTATLVFQNGDGMTDGIRYVSADGSYTDTVLYDAPNTNQLPDDSGYPGTSFAPDVPAGYSLARIADGYDNDDCATDCLAETNPSPGLSNRVYCDYAISNPVLDQVFSVWQFRAYIVNCSIVSAQQPAQLTFMVNSVIYDVMDITPLAGGDSIQVVQHFPHAINQPLILAIDLYLPNDPSYTNNTWSYHYQPPHSIHVRINEFLYLPETGKQEWIELRLSEVPTADHNLILKDLAQYQITVTIPAGSPPYIVLCNNPTALLNEYPSCPANSVVQVTGWIPLNNEADTMYLMDADGVVTDTVSYTGSATYRGVSLERDENADLPWRYCLDPEKGTPGRSNSISQTPPVMSGELALERSSFAPKRGETLRLFYHLPDNTSRIN
ncbi:MAG: lamin tail domain-containing protein, partial [Candidatus Cloacimonetes bacterium]|nr:lamin tail domain-containing protein [Candidatus Cloacimonadota bacterium]